jgi:PTS system beta-glucosides-specific IIC component
MDLFVLGAVAVLAAMTGFWTGRSIQWQLVEAEGATGEVTREKRAQAAMIAQGKEIGSPVAGEATAYQEDGRHKVRIRPEQGKVYAPAAGKITRLYPMGSAMLLQTEFGAEILLQAGSHVDEMCSAYYRCRVMEHEYVRKGALLYDCAGIVAEGADGEVIVSVENEEELEGVTALGQSRAKVGEPILYVVNQRHSPSHVLY